MTNEVQEEFAQFQRDSAYFRDRVTELTQQYPDQWVAVFNHEVVGADQDPNRLIADLIAKGVPVGRIVAFYLPTKERNWVLGSQGG